MTGLCGVELEDSLCLFSLVQNNSACFIQYIEVNRCVSLTCGEEGSSEKSWHLIFCYFMEESLYECQAKCFTSSVLPTMSIVNIFSGTKSAIYLSHFYIKLSSFTTSPSSLRIGADGTCSFSLLSIASCISCSMIFNSSGEMPLSFRAS